MNEQPKNKVLVLIIGCLLVTNIALVVVFLLNNKDEKKHADRNAYVMTYLEKEVGFNKGQLAKYDSLGKQHREQVRAAFKDISESRKSILKGLAAADFSDSAINSASDNIYEGQKILQLKILKHLKGIRDICTEEQRSRFDTGFYKIFGRRGDNNKRK